MTAEGRAADCTTARHVFWPDAYRDGARAGAADRRLGFRSEYAWHGVDLATTYTYAWHYSRGYRDARMGRVS